MKQWMLHNPIAHKLSYYFLNQYELTKEQFEYGLLEIQQYLMPLEKVFASMKDCWDSFGLMMFKRLRLPIYNASSNDFPFSEATIKKYEYFLVEIVNYLQFNPANEIAAIYKEKMLGKIEKFFQIKISKRISL